MADIRHKISGFTLVEMSLVLIVIGLIIFTVFPALKAVRQSSQRQLTTSNLTTLLRATAAFVQANGCVPCPTPASTFGSGFGRVRGSTNTTLCGTCSVPEGIPPYASLGLPAATAKDGWGRWITMRIDPTLATNFKVVPPTSACLADSPAPCELGKSQRGLCRANLSDAKRVQILVSPSQTLTEAAILFVSHGPNGYGAFQAAATAGVGSNEHSPYNGPATSCTTTTGFELCNADGDDGSLFVDAPRTENKTDPFDDTLVYLDRNALVAYLGQGACQTAW